MTHGKSLQFVSFQVAGRLYGIDVLKVHEVTPALPTTTVPAGPDFVQGLINLRGQISTVISLRKLLRLNEQDPTNQMYVVCYYNELLLSFMVDSVGDVLEMSEKDFEPTPDTVNADTRRYLDGVFKTNSALLSVIDVHKIGHHFEGIQKELAI